jgi:hypothetical protein
LAQVGWLRCRSFKSSSEYLASLESEHCTLPLGFRVGTSSFKFVPQEAPLPNTMTLTLIVPDEPTSQWGAVFTQNAFPGAPIKIGRELLSTEKLGAIVINNKISNVCAQGGGVEDSKRLCSAISEALQLPSDCAVLPSSTGALCGFIRYPTCRCAAFYARTAHALSPLWSLGESSRSLLLTVSRPRHVRRHRLEAPD